MLYTQTVEAATLDLIKILMDDAELSKFNLVGGTALSLMIGHRKSIDIDFFIDSDFDVQYLAHYLSKNYEVEGMKTLKNGIFCFIQNVKLDLIAHQYPILNPIKIEGGIRMLSMEDISAMKINAILNNGSRLKDFVDIYFMLEKIPLQKMTSAFGRKYSDVNTQMAHTALLYHKDIITSEKIEFLVSDITLIEMANRFKVAVGNPALIFNSFLLKQLSSKKNNPKLNKSANKKKVKRPKL